MPAPMTLLQVLSPMVFSFEMFSQYVELDGELQFFALNCVQGEAMKIMLTNHVFRGLCQKLGVHGAENANAILQPFNAFLRNRFH